MLHFYCSVDKSILAIGLTFMMFEGVNGFKLLHVSDIKSFKNVNNAQIFSFFDDDLSYLLQINSEIFCHLSHHNNISYDLQ